MALETGTYVNSLNASNPASTDGLAQADDHIRLLKSTIKATLPNVTGAITATHTELNKMDGVTATTAELNTTAGLTASTAELNKLDGVTASTEINKIDGLTASTADLNILDGLTASTAELNYVDGVTSNIQTQLNGIQTIPSQATSTWVSGTDTTESTVSAQKLKAAIDAGTLNMTTGTGTAQIGSLKMAWGKNSCVAGGTVSITLPFSYSSTSSYSVVAMSDDGNHPGATRGAQGVSKTAVNQIVYAKAGFAGSSVHWYTIGY